ncbi:MAG: primosomal protein N' [Candidatus Melainabacteria bacterium]|nr:MAG: primosomal protein N' [Candidatus Melainabacteria bacterium]
MRVYEKISQKFTSSDYNFDPILLHGITGSGKTEIYFKLIDDTLKSGKNVMFLLPEIALASQILKRLIRKFDKNVVAIWHSSISEGEKYDIWQKINNDEIRILVGVRSAVFAPIKNLGLIIIDEEHESSYKQTNPSPRYNAIVVAKKLAKIYEINLLLGSATPSVETYYETKNTNNIFCLKTRFNNAKMAKVNIIDMREEMFKTKGGFFSIPLIKAIENTLSQKKTSHFAY